MSARSIIFLSLIAVSAAHASGEAESSARQRLISSFGERYHFRPADLEGSSFKLERAAAAGSYHAYGYIRVGWTQARNLGEAVDASVNSRICALSPTDCKAGFHHTIYFDIHTLPGPPDTLNWYGDVSVDETLEQAKTQQARDVQAERVRSAQRAAQAKVDAELERAKRYRTTQEKLIADAVTLWQQKEAQGEVDTTEAGKQAFVDQLLKETSAKLRGMGLLGPREIKGQPKALNPIMPRYPPAAIRHHLSGTVGLFVGVGPSGEVSTVYVANSSGSALLDHAAEAAAHRWRFEPAREGSVPVPSFGYYQANFTL